MRNVFRMLFLAVFSALFLQCGKGDDTSGPGQAKTGTKVRFEPFDLPPQPSGTVYQGWIVSLARAGSDFDYVPVYSPFDRFQWNNYVYTFLDPQGQPRTSVFETRQELFNQNFNTVASADIIRAIVLKMAKGDSVFLTLQNRPLSLMKAILLTVEPANETPPNDTLPATPFLIGITNDSGVISLVYPINYKNPDFTANYFIASPSDTLLPLTGSCCFDTTLRSKLNEARGIWFGEFFNETGHADTILAALPRLNGWQFEGWLQKGATLASLGKFRRADSADFSNPYACDPARLFNFPGEDFCNNPPPEITNVLDGVIMITLEVDPDPDPAIFPLFLYRDTIRSVIISGTGSASVLNLHRTFPLDNRSRFLPTIRAVALEENP